MRILVTGGAGFIGSHIAELALSSGHEVAVLDDLSTGKRENLPSGVELYVADVRDRSATENVFQTFKPEAVSHQAAQASVSISMKDPGLDAEINILGGLNVATSARDCGCERFVFASTGGAIYGNIARDAAAEDWRTDPISPYAINKYAYEKLLSVFRGQGAFQSTILRYANVYGPRQDPHGEAGVVAIFYRRVLTNLDIQVNGMQRSGDDGCIRDYVYVADVARANLAALTGKLESPLMNIGTGVETTTRALARSICSSMPDSTTQISNGPPREGDVERSVLDGAKYVSEFGGFVSLEDGLALTRDWFRANQ